MVRGRSKYRSEYGIIAFGPFDAENMNKTNKYSLNNSKMAEYYSIFDPNTIQYSLQGRILRP